jgi:hypothetical protein
MFAAMIFALPCQWIYHWHLERRWRLSDGKFGGCTYFYRRGGL